MNSSNPVHPASGASDSTSGHRRYIVATSSRLRHSAMALESCRRGCHQVACLSKRNKHHRRGPTLTCEATRRHWTWRCQSHDSMPCWPAGTHTHTHCAAREPAVALSISVESLSCELLARCSAMRGAFHNSTHNGENMSGVELCYDTCAASFFGRWVSFCGVCIGQRVC